MVISSTNTQNSVAFARDGDTVTLTLTSDEDLSSLVATIGGETATISNTSLVDWTATLLVTATTPVDTTPGNVSVNVTFTDLAGNVNSTQTVTSGGVEIGK